MVAAVIVSGPLPYRFDSRIRTASPPTVTRTVCRTVWFTKPSVDQFGSKLALGRCIEVVQAAAQVIAVADRARPVVAGSAGLVRGMADSPGFDRELIRDSP
jgi:hypothetical protein